VHGCRQPRRAVNVARQTGLRPACVMPWSICSASRQDYDGLSNIARAHGMSVLARRGAELTRELFAGASSAPVPT